MVVIIIVEVFLDFVGGWNPKIRNVGKESRYSEAVSSFTN